MREHTETETITISKCPKCGRSHRYALEVRRSYVSGIMPDPPESIRQCEFTRLFTCLIKESDFQASFALKESPSDKIKMVSVAGLAQG